MPKLTWYPLPLIVITILIGTSTCTELELWRNACPFNKFCTTDSLSTLNTTDETVQPCCSNCSCEEDCWVFNNCCPDVTHDMPDGLKMATCRGMQVVNNNTASFTFHTKYRVIDFCPRDYDVTNQQVIDQCEGRFGADSGLSDVVAVSDSKNRIYKNKHCAYCHGVHDVQSWTLRLLICASTLNPHRIAASQYARTLLENCQLESVPPSIELGASVAPMSCDNSIYDDCPSTMSQDALINARIDGCLNGPNMLFQHRFYVMGFFVPYKNVFCYLCRENDFDEMMCPASSGYEPIKSSFVPYNILLDTTTASKVNPTTMAVIHTCNETEFYDKAKERCIPLYCPPFSVVMFGNCLDIGSQGDTNYVDIRVQYEPLEEHVLSGRSDEYDTPATNSFINRYLRFYALEMCRIITFDLFVYVNKASNVLRYVLIEMRFQTDAECRMDDLTRAIRLKLSSRTNVSMVMNGDPVPLAGQIRFFQSDADDAYHVFKDSDDLYTNWVALSKGGPSFTTLLEFTFFLCPYFVINTEEYNTIINDVTEIGSVRNLTEITESTRVKEGFYTLSSSKIAVCVDTYVGLPYYKTSRASFKMASRFVFLLGVLLACRQLVSMPF